MSAPAFHFPNVAIAALASARHSASSMHALASLQRGGVIIGVDMTLGGVGVPELEALLSGGLIEGPPPLLPIQ